MSTPSHGTTAIYRRGCRCDRCRAANTRYDQYRRLDLLQGRTRTIDATGTIRRIEALQRLGWSMQAIADRSGYRSLQAIKRITERDRLTLATAERIDAAFEALCMIVGPSTAARNAAIRKGYAPPLAWDNIDDPDEKPRDWHYTAPDRATALRDMAELGVGVTEACRRLHVTRDGLEKWAQRNGMSDVYRVLAAREAMVGNQYTREDVA